MNVIVLICEVAKEISNMLEMTWKETSQVHEIKIDILVSKYELFEMKKVNLQ